MPTNSISQTGVVRVTYPAQLTLYSNNFTCSITTNKKISNVCTLDLTSRKITITGAFAGIDASTRFSASILIELYPIRNPIDNRVVNAFIIETFDDAAISQKIDTLADNLLFPTLECNYPCKTCLGSDPDYCLSCWADDTKSFLQYTSSSSDPLGTQTCQENCNTGFTTNGDTNKVCLSCDPMCATCQDTGTVGDKFKCTKCADSTPFIYPDKKCMRTCEGGFYESKAKTCSPCSSPCFSCNSTATQCMDCQKDGLYPYLYNKTCLTKCFDFFAGVDNQCLACQSPCKKCINSTTQCLSCDQTQSLKYWFSYQCYKDCPSGTVKDDSQMICKGCLTGCQKCDEKNQTKCYECIKPLILYNEQCLTDCPEGLRLNDDGTNCVVPDTEVKDLTLVYFPFLICALLMAIVAIGGEIKDRKNIVLTNCIVLWGPVEQLVLIAQVALSYLYEGSIIFYASAGIFVINLLINFIFSKRFDKRVI